MPFLHFIHFFIVFFILFSMLGIEYVIRQITKMKQIGEKENHDSVEDKARPKEYLKMPNDFECFVCGTKFVTNEEWKHHLESSTHGHFYDTTSPQEQEEIRSSKDQ
jgi:hypothetical protein